MAAEFAEPFGGAALTRLAGYLHDAGKSAEEVQRRFRELSLLPKTSRGRLGVPHKVEGAQLMAALLGRGRAPLSLVGYLINHGHHAGIPAKGAVATTSELAEAWGDRNVTKPFAALMGRVLGQDLEELAQQCELPAHVTASIQEGDWSHLELFTRMCHSALVDADFLDTSAHFGDHGAPWRSESLGMAKWLGRFNAYYAELRRAAAPSGLNTVRNRVFDACVTMAVQDLSPGIYRLPAPTGTGKTLASAAFALHHAVRFDRSRVIVAVPFTTITTQNAAAYREAFGDLSRLVLEHHSNVIDDDVADHTWQRLSAPGWDAEFIVTTTVQLFESLFSNRPSKTRKLHRIVNSVVVLDEVQALPIHLLGPVLAMLRELVEHYGVTVLLASATQPSFWTLPVWNGLPVHDILPVASRPEVTQRVTYEVRTRAQSWEEIAQEVAAIKRLLLIANRRRDADALYSRVARVRGTDEAFLLSKSMTADHRDRVLAEVRARLNDGRRVAVVSTQLVEAGVDIDFPVVYRAIAPAEGLVQAGGRCNREGSLGVRGGRVVVFLPAEGGNPPGIYETQTGIARSMFVDQPRSRALDAPEDLAEYFDEVYRATDLQRRQIEKTLGEHRVALDFPELARCFRMIDEHSVDAVVVDHPDPEVRSDIAQTVERVRASPQQPLGHAERRLLQRHSASISRSDISLTDEIARGVRVWCGAYDAKRGVTSDLALTW